MLDVWTDYTRTRIVHGMDKLISQEVKINCIHMYTLNILIKK